MKKILILTCLTLLNFSNVSAVTLYDALNQTYQNNIQLNAERENLKASEEDVNISKAIAVDNPGQLGLTPGDFMEGY